jgi:hypothetical protein
MSINTKNDKRHSTKGPELPPLYFKNSSVFSTLCSELETHILSYLNWGDYARLTPVHSSLANIVKDAAAQCDDAKWTLAQ